MKSKVNMNVCLWLASCEPKLSWACKFFVVGFWQEHVDFDVCNKRFNNIELYGIYIWCLSTALGKQWNFPNPFTIPTHHQLWLHNVDHIWHCLCELKQTVVGSYKKVPSIINFLCKKRSSLRLRAFLSRGCGETQIIVSYGWCLICGL